MRTLLLVCSWMAAAGGVAQAAQPNILLIMADDLGYSDLGCYGSEIDTPHLDRLAAGGLRFSQFYNTAKCHSSRVSLLTGRWCRQAGDTRLDRAVTTAEVLAPAGYFTAMTGKWHLSKQPTDFGFQRYFGHLSGACNYYKGDNTFRLNGQPWNVPHKDFYTTVANVDHAITFLGEARTQRKPWFLYVAFNAPHAPLQPLEADYKKYLGRYDVGWDVIRAGRVAKQKAIGLLPKELEVPPRADHVAAWETLESERRQWESRRMAAYAALIDRMDQEIGRLITDLRKTGELDNTVILFVSDNGACPYDRGTPEPDRQPFDPDTKWSDSTGWAWARNAPFRYYKQNQFEGGISTPAILHWPAGLAALPNSITDTPAHLVDVLPTLAELAGAKLPQSFPGRELTPLAGISLAPLIAGREIKSRPPIHLLFSKDRGLRDGPWKLVSFQSQPWELYHIATDRAEVHNVADEHPDIVKRMVRQWHDMAENVLDAPAKEVSPVATEAAEQRHAQWTDFEATLGDSGTGGRKKRGGGDSATDGLPRARVGTKLRVEQQQLVLDCSGDDPGLAFNQLGVKQPGPYTLSFRVQSSAGGGAEIYWTTDPQTTLPRGKRQSFTVRHDSQWHDVTVEIPEATQIHALRIDPCSAPGEVRIESLRLKNADGQTLRAWP